MSSSRARKTPIRHHTRRNREDGPEEDAVDAGQLEQAGNLQAEKHHQDGLDDHRQEDAPELAAQTPQVKLHTDGEHQENHPEFAQGLDRAGVADRGKGQQVGPDQQPAEDVPEDDGKLELVEKQRHRDGHHRHDPQVVDEGGSGPGGYGERQIHPLNEYNRHVSGAN